MSEKKYCPVFFSKHDEIMFEEMVKEVVPDLVFVDGSIWKDDRPIVKTSMADCKHIVFLWSPKACPQLPFKKYDNGVTRGPISGVVIQFDRGVEKRKTITSGHIGIGYDKSNLAIKGFVTDVWKVLKSLNSARLCGFDPKTGEVLDRNIKMYIVGPGAKELSLKGTLLKSDATDVYYKIEPCSSELPPKKARAR
jgi:hypothetical protein